MHARTLRVLLQIVQDKSWTPMGILLQTINKRSFKNAKTHPFDFFEPITDIIAAYRLG